MAESTTDFAGDGPSNEKVTKLCRKSMELCDKPVARGAIYDTKNIRSTGIPEGKQH